MRNLSFYGQDYFIKTLEYINPNKVSITITTNIIGLAVIFPEYLSSTMKLLSVPKDNGIILNDEMDNRSFYIEIDEKYHSPEKDDNGIFFDEIYVYFKGELKEIL